MAQRTIAERNPPAGDHRFARLFVVENIGAPALQAHPLRLKTAPPPRKWGIRPPVSLRDEHTGCQPTSAMLTSETGPLGGACA